MRCGIWARTLTPRTCPGGHRTVAAHLAVEGFAGVLRWEALDRTWPLLPIGPTDINT